MLNFNSYCVCCVPTQHYTRVEYSRTSPEFVLLLTQYLLMEIAVASGLPALNAFDKATLAQGARKLSNFPRKYEANILSCLYQVLQLLSIEKTSAVCGQPSCKKSWQEELLVITKERRYTYTSVSRQRIKSTVGDKAAVCHEQEQQSSYVHTAPSGMCAIFQLDNRCEEFQE